MKAKFAPVLILLACLACRATAPGTRHSSWPNVIASDNENWMPAPGYSWVYPNDQSDLSVRWEPGKAYYSLDRIEWPHVIAANTEGQWYPEPGYTWANTDSAGRPIL